MPIQFGLGRWRNGGMEGYAWAREHKSVTQPYSIIAALVAACIAAIAVAAYLGAVGMDAFAIESALFGLGFTELILAVGLTYVLFALHSALARNETSERPYGMVGAAMVSSIAAVGILAYLGAVGIGTFTVQSSLFGLAFIELFLAIGLCYVLFTLRSSLISREDNDHSYGVIGALLLMGIAATATLAYFGVMGLGLFSERSALFGLASIELVLALGLCYVLFTMKGSITELRYQRTGGWQVQRRPATPESIATPHPAIPSPATSAWTPVPQREGMHAARAQGTSAIEIEGIGLEDTSRLKFAASGRRGTSKRRTRTRRPPPRLSTSSRRPSASGNPWRAAWRPTASESSTVGSSSVRESTPWTNWQRATLSSGPPRPRRWKRAASTARQTSPASRAPA